MQTDFAGTLKWQRHIAVKAAAARTGERGQKRRVGSLEDVTKWQDDSRSRFAVEKEFQGRVGRCRCPDARYDTWPLKFCNHERIPFFANERIFSGESIVIPAGAVVTGK